MRSLASLIMKSRVAAVTVVAVCAVLSLIFPAVGYLAAAAIALVTLRAGPVGGLWLAVIGGLATAVLSMLTVGTPVTGGVLMLTQWLPVVLVATVLRVTSSQGSALMAAGLAGVVAVLGFYLVLDAPADWWREMLQRMLEPMLAGSNLTLSAEVYESVARTMTGIVVAGSILGAMVALFLGRWWQSTLYNPGGFGEEFRALRLPPGIAMGMLLLMAAAMFLGGSLAEIALNLAVVTGSAFLLNGVALIHGVVKRRSGSVGWLIGMYLGMLLWAPWGLIFVSGLGFADSWVNFRGRLDTTG